MPDRLAGGLAPANAWPLEALQFLRPGIFHHPEKLDMRNGRRAGSDAPSITQGLEGVFNFTSASSAASKACFRVS
jgi:hypothetical protein